MFLIKIFFIFFFIKFYKTILDMKFLDHTLSAVSSYSMTKKNRHFCTSEVFHLLDTVHHWFLVS